MTGTDLVNGGTFNNSPTVASSGAVTLTGGTLGGSGWFVATSPLARTGGTISCSVQCNGGSISSGSTKTLLGGRLINTGPIAASMASGSFFTGSGSVISNLDTGIFSLSANSGTTYNNTAPRGLIYNSGLFGKTAGAGISAISDTFTNSGTVAARSGTLEFAQACVRLNGETRLSEGKLQADQGFLMLGGALTGTNNLVGSVTNLGGTLSPGASPGKLTITGNYVQGSGAAFAVELGGTTPCTGFDQVAVSGSALLAGTLNVSLYGGFYPAPNATFTYLTAASRSGVFSSFNYPSNVVGLTNELTATTATIRVINTLPVITPVDDRTNDEMVAFNVTAIANDYGTPAHTLTWSLVSGPPELGISSGGAISWTPAEDQGPNTNTVSIRITDNGFPNLSATNAFQLVINEINRAPSLFLPPDTAVNEMTPLSLNAAATDPDIPTNTLTFELVSRPPGLTVSPEGQSRGSRARQTGRRCTR